MNQNLGQVTLLVHDYDEAIMYFTEKLKFAVREDQQQPGKRWVVVTPPGAGGASVLLALASNAAQQKSVGWQTGGRVAFFLYTDDFWRDYEHMRNHGVEFIGHPREEDYGTVIVFKDLYGNKWDFIQQRTSPQE